MRFSALGDVVLTSAAIGVLAEEYPQARIVFATKKSFAGLLADDPRLAAVEGLEPGESLLRFRRRLMVHAPDAVLDLHGKLRSRTLSRMLPARVRVCWKKRIWGQGAAVRMRLRKAHAGATIAQRHHEAVERLVGRPLAPGAMKLFVSDAHAAQARQRLLDLGIHTDAPLVGLSPGSIWPTKCWPVENFEALMRHADAAGVQLLVTGSPQESELVQGLCDAVPGAVNAAGLVGISQLPALVGACDAFVANDSGPMHVARALGVPTVAFFGSTDPQQFNFEGHHLQYADVSCAPCSLYGLRRCPEQHFKCMRDLAPAHAWQALRAALDGGRVSCVQG